MKFLKPHVWWGEPFIIGLILAAWFAGAAFGILAFHTPKRPAPVVEQRAVISNHASTKQVIANLDRKHPAGVGQYVAGFSCAAWSNGNKTTHHGWVVFYCAK